jgi:CRISPR system Cascade subunit CasE
MTLIASVLHLSRQDVRALRITDPYSLHRVVYSLYEDTRTDAEKQASTPSGLLYADQGGDVRGRRILLLADRWPAGCVNGGYGRVESKLVDDSFLDFSRYRFRVTVNPTRRDSASGRLRPVKGRESIAAWFAERAPASWGFRVVQGNLEVGSTRALQFKGKNGHPVTLAQAQLQGLLEVTDPEQFRSSFRQGIGRGRAFGCGLLQIVPHIDHPFA